MKQLFTTILFLSILVTHSGCRKDKNETDGEFLAPTAPMSRMAVLEDFTGVRCSMCPDGHLVAWVINNKFHPDSLITLAHHAGYFANPTTGWPNFTTPYGNALIEQAKVASYPAGTINRMKCSDLGVREQKPGGYAMSRGEWIPSVDTVITLPAPVNLGAKATYDPATRKLSIKVDVYYTSGVGTPNRLNVFLLQDHIFSKQENGTPDPDHYEQNHVVRDFITGQWGDGITESASQGTKITRKYTYTVPKDYNGLGLEGGGAVVIDDLKIVAFVTNGQTDILNAVEVDVE